MRQYIIDAFSDRPFSGNPAAVCVLDAWMEESVMMSIAGENNLSETAFIVREGNNWRLRWFTPTCEVGLCGHATLASGHVLLNYYEPEAPSVTFLTQGGRLTVSRAMSGYEMLFPSIPLSRVKVTSQMIEQLGMIPIDAWMGKDLDLILVLGDESQVRDFTPDADTLKSLPGRMVHITSPGSGGYDCCSRCFGPKIGILEDPVCGSAHCQIIPYWARRLGKNVIRAWEASSRGGELTGEIIDEETIKITGKACTFAISELSI